MPTRKQERVAERIREILSALIEFEASDPRLDDVTVIGVKIDRELMVANVLVSSLRGEEARQEVMDGLRSATGFLRRELGARMRLRRVPELRFNWDETAIRAARIDALLDSLDIPPAEEETDQTDDADG